MAASRKAYEIRTQWDGEAGVWWCSNDELPLTTEAPTFEQLVARVLEIVPEIAAENGLAAPGDEIELHAVAERAQSVPVVPPAADTMTAMITPNAARAVVIIRWPMRAFVAPGNSAASSLLLWRRPSTYGRP